MGPLLRNHLEGGSASDLSFLSGSDADRLAELNWAMEGDFQACWVVRGGHGLTRLTPTWQPPASPRPLLGFSDVTALHQCLLHRGWSHLIHAANVQTLPLLDAESLEATRALLMEGRVNPMVGRQTVPGVAEGRLWGGNLCLLACLCGTPQALPQGQDLILALEDLNEAPYRLDRLLTQLEASGAFRSLKAVCLGEFRDCGDAEEVWAHWRERWGLPVLEQLPFGHGRRNHPLWLGQPVRVGYNQMSWLSRLT